MPDIADTYRMLKKEIIENEFKSLNDMQFKAVTQVKGAVLILAGRRKRENHRAGKQGGKSYKIRRCL